MSHKLHEDSLMKKLTSDKVKQEELKVLLAFDRLAKDHGIQYSLAYGTLLGAIRHRGFIPWDDDIDVMVPRPDYEKLLNLIKEHRLGTGELVFQGFELGNFPMPYLKFSNSNIEVRDIANKASIPLYLWIDVFPLDGVPADEVAWAAECSKAQTWKNLIKAGNYRFFGAGKGLRNRLAKMAVKPWIAALGLDDRAEKSIITTAKTGPSYTEAEFVADVVWGPYGKGERFSKGLIGDYVLVEFEGHELPALSGWDAYLTGIYGDYMELPPVEKRVAHGVEAWVEESAHE